MINILAFGIFVGVFFRYCAMYLSFNRAILATAMFVLNPIFLAFNNNILSDMTFLLFSFLSVIMLSSLFTATKIIPIFAKSTSNINNRFHNKMSHINNAYISPPPRDTLKTLKIKTYHLSSILLSPQYLQPFLILSAVTGLSLFSRFFAHIYCYFLNSTSQIIK